MLYMCTRSSNYILQEKFAIMIKSLNWSSVFSLMFVENWKRLTFFSLSLDDWLITTEEEHSGSKRLGENIPKLSQCAVLRQMGIDSFTQWLSFSDRSDNGKDCWKMSYITPVSLDKRNQTQKPRDRNYNRDIWHINFTIERRLKVLWTNCVESSVVDTEVSGHNRSERTNWVLLHSGFTTVLVNLHTEDWPTGLWITV